MRILRLALLATFLVVLLAPLPVAAHEPVSESIARLNQRLAGSPGDASLWLRRGELRRKAHEFDAAAADLRRASELAPALPGLALAHAALALDRGDATAALSALDRAPAADAASGEAHGLRARAHTARGDSRAAIAAWNAAIAALEAPQPDDYLERARLQLAIDDPDAARAGLHAGLARLGPAASLAAALRALGDEAAMPGPLAAAAPAASPASASPGPQLDAAITRGPYLQTMTPSGVTVRWRTNVATNSRVQYVPAAGGTPLVQDDLAVVTEHTVTLSGLTADTRYVCAIGSTSETLMAGDSVSFRTHPVPGTERVTRIWAIGDAGIAGTAQNQVRDAFVNWAGANEPDVWLMLGDNAYNSGTDAEYTAGLFTPYRNQLIRWPAWPTRGNHDALFTGANNDYYEFFTLPTAGQSGGTPSGTEAYYSFDHGPVHFICLDSEGSARTPGSAMLLWLASDLAATTRKWIVAYFHHPPYTKGSHDSDNAGDSAGRMRDMRENVLPILEAAGVDLVLTGHSHSYERSFLLDGHYGLSSTLTGAMILGPGDGRPDGDGPYTKATPGKAPHEGAVYAVGGSSAQISGGTLNHPAMVRSLNVLGSMVIDIDGDRLDSRFLDNLGAVRDSFAIVKGGSTAVDPVRSPRGLSLGPALPNPFGREVSLDFALPRAGEARLDVYDAAGRRVATLARGAHAAGAHSVRWDGTGPDGRRLPAGVYLAALQSDGERVVRRVALVK